MEFAKLGIEGVVIDAFSGNPRWKLDLGSSLFAFGLMILFNRGIAQDKFWFATQEP